MDIAGQAVVGRVPLETDLSVDRRLPKFISSSDRIRHLVYRRIAKLMSPNYLARSENRILSGALNFNVP